MQNEDRWLTTRAVCVYLSINWMRSSHENRSDKGVRLC